MSHHFYSVFLSGTPTVLDFITWIVVTPTAQSNKVRVKLSCPVYISHGVFLRIHLAIDQDKQLLKTNEIILEGYVF